MCSYLHRAPNGVYYFRMSIPVELRPFMGGGREIKHSLRLKDRDAAKALIPDHTKAAHKLLAQARRALQGSQPKDPQQVARQRRAEELARKQEDWVEDNARLSGADIAKWEVEDEERAERIAAQAAEAAHLERVLRTGKTAQMAPHDAVRIRAIREADERAKLAEEQSMALMAELAAARQGDSKTVSAAPTPPQPAAPSEKRFQGNSGATVTGIFNAYAATDALTPAIVTEWTKKVALFVKFLGHDDAGRVTPEDIRLWRNHVRDEVQPNGKKRSAQTVNAGYLAAVRAAFKHGFNEGLLPTNPARDVSRVQPSRTPKIREKDFTKAEQKIVLTAATAIDTSGKPIHQTLVRRWVPWICAYTGARVNEITQMRGEDVQEIDGHWVIKITPEAGRVKTKDFRYVPVHEHLLDQGFLAMVKAQGDGPIFYDPERADPDSERGQYKKVGERLAAWVRSLGITDPNIKPNHAWRHTFKTVAQEVGMDERAADYMQGHASKGVGRSYGHSTIKAVTDQMALIPRFNID